MAATTTIRIDRETHQRLVAISRATGRQLLDVVRDAAEALERTRFATDVNTQLDRLRQDPAAWEAYVNEADLAVRHGLG
ncbi:MAG: hypothetical protein ACKV2O_16680 [Acidimicrobiales bacterium]